MWAKKALKATSPPAEAPMPTTGQHTRAFATVLADLSGEDFTGLGLFELDLGIRYSRITLRWIFASKSQLGPNYQIAGP
jgi:hypothetical protein